MQWLWKQHYRLTRGAQLIGFLNLALLLVQSTTLKGYLNLSSSQMLYFGLPSALCVVWFCGYCITLPQVQAAEDRAQADVTQVRRDLDEILRLLKHDDKIRSQKADSAVNRRA